MVLGKRIEIRIRTDEEWVEENYDGTAVYYSDHFLFFLPLEPTTVTSTFFYLTSYQKKKLYANKRKNRATTKRMWNVEIFFLSLCCLFFSLFPSFLARSILYFSLRFLARLCVYFFFFGFPFLFSCLRNVF